MEVTPYCDGTSPLVFDVALDVAELGAAVTRQRVRFETMLRGFDEAQWQHPTRCEAWTTRDVVAHLVTVNRFGAFSVRSGVAGTPSRVLQGFDPAAGPKAVVAAMHDVATGDLFAQFADASADFLDAIASVNGDEWDALSESPAGHVPVWSVAHHALWDLWIHERDVALPLGLTPPVEADEVLACLRYCAVIGPVLALAAPDVGGTYAIDARSPEL